MISPIQKSSQRLAIVLVFTLLLTGLPITAALPASQAAKQELELFLPGKTVETRSFDDLITRQCLAPELTDGIIFHRIEKDTASLLSMLKNGPNRENAAFLVKTQRYSYNNHLHYNLPIIVYRQSSSEHASEG